MTGRSVLALMLSALMVLTSTPSYGIETYAYAHEVKTKSGQTGIAVEEPVEGIGIEDVFDSISPIVLPDPLAGGGDGLSDDEEGDIKETPPESSEDGAVDSTGDPDSESETETIDAIGYLSTQAESDASAGGTPLDLVAGDTFVAVNESGIAISYEIIAQASDTTVGKVRIGATKANGASAPAIDTGTAGPLVIPSLVHDEQGSAYKVESIGSAAFFNAAKLTDIFIPASVTSLGTTAFAACTSVTNVTFETGSPISALPHGAFNGCTALTSISLPAGLVSINASVFAECTSLVQLDLPDSVAVIGANAFERSGISSITFPTALYSIGLQAFKDTPLRTVRISASIATIGSGAFSNCSYLSSVTFDEQSFMTTISDNLFSNCSSLSSIVFPPKLRSIGDSAFKGCQALTSLYFPAMLRSVGSAAFQGCLYIETIVFGGDVEKATSETNSFYQCPSISSVIFMGKKTAQFTFLSAKPTYYYSIIYYDGLDSSGNDREIGRAVVKAGSIPANLQPGELYQGALLDPPQQKQWTFESDFSMSATILDSTYVRAQSKQSDLAIGDTFVATTVDGVPVTYRVTGVADGYTSGTVQVGVGLPGITAIDPLTAGTITLPRYVLGSDANRYEVTGISDDAFSNCNRFIEVVIPSSVISIGKTAFKGCSTLQEITFEGDASSITDNGIFTACNNITTVIFGGKKANIAFGFSNPSVFYTVTYYADKHDLDIDNPQGHVVFKQGSLLGSLGADDIYKGSVPTLEPGMGWSYETGFSEARPLMDSCFAYQESEGFQADVELKGAGTNTQKIPCWFKVITSADGENRGTVQVGIGADGLPAVDANSTGTLIIPSMVTDDEGSIYDVRGIGPYAFGSSQSYQSCSNLLRVEIPETVTFIGDSAFEYCSFLNTVNIPSGLDTLGARVFRNCSALTTVTLENASNLRSIKQETFSGCSALASISIPSQVDSIGDRAFYSCFYLKKLTFEGDADAISMGQNAFYCLARDFTTLIYKANKRNDFTIDGSYPYNETRPSNGGYRTYYQVKFYKNKAEFDSGVPSEAAILRENSIISSIKAGEIYAGSIPSEIASYCTWRYQDGFSATAALMNSCYAVAMPDISYASASGLEGPFYYTGERLTPKPVLTMPDGRVLVENVDYTLGSYINNRGVGTATLPVTGCGDYTGYREYTFTIKSKPGDQSTMIISDMVASVTFNGTPQYPSLTVSNPKNGKTLLFGKDYEVYYYNNVDAGTAVAVVLGRGNYLGTTATREFTIKPLSLASCVISSINSVYAYTGNPITPAVSISDPTGRTLDVGVDYVANYSGNTNVGEASLYLGGRGNYTGVVVLTFSISGKSGGPNGSDGNGTGVSGTGSGRGNSGQGTGSGLLGTGAGTADVSQGFGSSAGNMVASLAQGSPDGDGVEEGASGGSGFSVSEVGIAPAENSEDVRSVVMLALTVALAIIAIGAFHRYGYFWRQTRYGRRLESAFERAFMP